MRAAQPAIRNSVALRDSANMIEASPLSLMAAGFYVFVAIAVCVAAGVAARHNQPPWHNRTWLLLGCLFSLLIVSRIFSLEDLLRDSLREMARSDGTYEYRRDFQRPLVAFIFVLFGAAASWWIYRAAKSMRGRRNFAVMAALASGFGMTGLIALRLISLHPIDALLYGPAKLNWVGDIGFGVIIVGAAVYYVRLIRSTR